MTIIIPEDYAVITFHMTGAQSDGEIVNTLGVGVPSSNDAFATVNHAAFAWATLIMPRVTNTVIFTGASMLIRRSGLLERWDSNVNAPTTGGNGPNQLPDNAAVLVQKVTAFAGKRNRGRMYLPGVDAGSVTINTLGPVALGQYQTALTAFGTELQDDEATFEAPMNPVVLHNSAGAPTEITIFRAVARLVTQRNRMRD